MRKIIPLLFFCLSVILTAFSMCGCSQSDGFSPPKIKSDFSSQAQIEYNGISISADVNALKENTVSITITEPPTLKGLSYRFTDSTLKMGYNGLDCTADEIFIPSDGFAGCLYKILTSISKNDFTFDKQQDEISQFHGKTGETEYSFTADNQTGRILGITASKPDMTVNFK